jgi:serine/threonine protein kinase
VLQEYCNGGSLGDAISDGLFGLQRSPLHWRRLLAVLLDIARGMAFIHSMRICHGDLNPANILLKVRRMLTRLPVRVVRHNLKQKLIPQASVSARHGTSDPSPESAGSVS